MRLPLKAFHIVSRKSNVMLFLLPRSLEKALKKQAKAKAEEQNPEQ